MIRKNIMIVTPVTFSIGDTQVAYVQIRAAYLVNDMRVSREKYEGKGGHKALEADFESCALLTLGNGMAHRPYGLPLTRTTLSPIGLTQEPIFDHNGEEIFLTWPKISSRVVRTTETVFNNFDATLEPGTFSMAQATENQYYLYIDAKAREERAALAALTPAPAAPVITPRKKSWLPMVIAAALVGIVFAFLYFSRNGESTPMPVVKKKEAKPAPTAPVVIEKTIIITRPATEVSHIEKPKKSKLVHADTTYYEAPMPVVKNRLLAPAFVFTIPAGEEFKGELLFDGMVDVTISKGHLQTCVHVDQNGVYRRENRRENWSKIGPKLQLDGVMTVDRTYQIWTNAEYSEVPVEIKKVVRHS